VPCVLAARRGDVHQDLHRSAPTTLAVRGRDIFQKYWGVVLRRAWKNTRHDFRLETNTRIVVALLIWIIVLYLSFETNPKEFSFAQPMQSAAKSLAAIFLLFPMWFVGRVSSSDMYGELIEKIDNLEREINKKEVMKGTLNDLADISNELKLLFTRKVNNDVELEEIKNEYYSKIERPIR